MSEAASASRWLCLDVTARDAACAELAAAEAFAAGAAGLEEREEAGGITLRLYLEGHAEEAVRAALGDVAGVTLAASLPCEDRDWSQAWREGLVALEFGTRLVVRPSFAPPVPGRPEVVIDPGQAFGTGGHESTRLALEGVAGLPDAFLRGARVLDVGTGSGVLALAALRLGAAHAVGLDLDPVAVREARLHAAANGLAGRLALAAAVPDALAPGARFDLVLANLLRREMVPVLPALARAVAPGGRLVLAGLLESEEREIARRAAAFRLRIEETRRHRDASGTAWLGLVLSAG